MANNVAVTAGTGTTFKTTDNAGVHTGHVNVDSIAAGTNAIGKLAANSGVDIGDVDVTSVIAGTGATNLGKAEDAAHSSGDTGVMALAVRKDTSSTGIGADGDYVPLAVSSTGHVYVTVDSTQLAALATTAQARAAGFQVVDQPTDGTLITKGLSNKAFSAVFSTLTRPANTTAYTAADSISDNATAGSVTALSATVSDTNNDPIFISDILVTSTDTGLAGKKIRAYLFNSDPTANTGVGAGDNAAYSQKVAGYIGSFMGWMETGFSDGTVGRLVPHFNETNYSQAGGFVVALPTSGAKTLYIQYQAVEAFTPSANSTTIIGRARGWQGRAA